MRLMTISKVRSTPWSLPESR